MGCVLREEEALLGVSSNPVLPTVEGYQLVCCYKKVNQWRNNFILSCAE